MSIRRLPAPALALVAFAMAVGGCGSGAPGPVSPPQSAQSDAAGSGGTRSQTVEEDPVDAIRAEVSAWPVERQAGRLLIVGTAVEGGDPTARDLIATRHVGGAFLHGRSGAGKDATRALVDDLRGAAPDPDTLIVATDQEGGDVQVLTGPGFTDMPYPTDQALLAPADLTAQATAWGSELADAGITLNLAPAVDLVPDEASAASNDPIGRWFRNYGYTAQSVAAGSGAFADGMEAAGIAVTLKHFPGLGRVAGNTDYEDEVRDSVTSRDDASVALFSRLARPTRLVMTSLATYELIDPAGPAAFSKAITTDLLRSTVGDDAVVITDDVSAAQVVMAWSPGERAVRAVEAGNDIVLASADPSVAGEMLDALIARAAADPDFAARVEESAARVHALATGALPG